LNDNLPVQIGFTVIFEKMNSVEMPKHFAYHTPLAQMAIQSLLYKPVIFTAEREKSTTEISSDQKVASLSFPCDLQLITCRPLRRNMITDRLLILHRPGMDCNGNENVTCSFGDFTRAVKNYLRRIGATKLQQTTLNGVDKIGDSINVNSVRIEIEPMDFLSFIVTIA
uniref:Rad60-SLD domain-containing protein n=1 Tax=Anisakis simplex TaxID=6269 RepID=A0A0M3J7G5_ANISI